MKNVEKLRYFSVLQFGALFYHISMVCLCGLCIKVSILCFFLELNVVHLI